MCGDIAIALPNRNDIHRAGNEYRIYRFVVEAMDYEDGFVLLYDLDNDEHFKWNLNVNINNRIHTIIILKNVFD
jgi:hypothetical protein